MSGDYSRQRFDPKAHFAGVLMQQGRVQLDSDWNEQVRILDRRFRAETMDLVSFGPNPDIAGVAVVPRLTPNAFRITSGASGVLTIGRGRMYVDGLLAENHGDPSTLEFDRLLDELRSTTDTAYLKQPYHPTAVALPNAGNILLYLDVWQREVGYLEQPAIVESAVGIDTTTRLQTVWQVRFLPNVGAGTTCSTPDAQIPGWLSLTAPSAGRLTTKAVGVAPEDDPCELPPIGGYRGLENQLYRVEIHDGGVAGTATFKWSRDNATVAASVVEVVSNHELRLDSFGRDSLLRIHEDDWVEIIDDWRELSGIAGNPAQRHGEMRRVTIDEDARTISFTPNLPADIIPAETGDDTLAKRHLRVRKWDQHGKVFRNDATQFFDVDNLPSSTGVIPVPAANVTLSLDAGIEVSFSLAGNGGSFQTGDYWLFAARTADASVEELTAAPPLGVHHHFARLAVSPRPGTPTDCRTMWPPESEGDHGCDCTVCVTPEQMANDPDALQKAVNIAGETGGSVCLSAGQYLLRDAVVIEKLESLEIHGRGHKTELIASKGAFRIGKALQVTVRDLAIHAVEPAIRVRSGMAVTLERLWIDMKSDFTALSLGGFLLDFALKDCRIQAPTGVMIGDPTEDKKDKLVAVGLLIRDNQLDCRDRGIDLTAATHLGLTRIEGNLITQAQDVAIALSSDSGSEGAFDVRGNLISANGDAIVASGSLRIEDNDIFGHDKETGGYGIVIRDDSSYKLRSGGVRILNNRVHNRREAGISIQTNVDTGMIKNNTITTARAGIIFEEDGQADSLTIENNQIFDINGREDDKEAASIGIRVIKSRLASIVNNTVRGVGLGNVKEAGRAGIQVLACEDVRIVGNDVSRIGPDTEFIGRAIGIHVLQPFNLVNVSDNLVNRDLARAANGPGPWSAVAIGFDRSDAFEIVKLDKKLITVKGDGGKQLYISGSKLSAKDGFEERIDLRGNVLRGGGTFINTVIQSSGECLISDNRIEHVGGQPAMAVQAEFAIVSANRVFGPERSMVLDIDPKRSTVLGNITRTPIDMHGPLTAPWAVLNVQA